MSKQSKRLLTDFVEDAKRTKQRARCPVCKLSKDVREQIREGRSRGIKAAVVAAWLKSEYNIDLVVSDFTRHGNGHHDA